MADTPRISVLLPVHNCERYVAKAMRSILAQTASEFELIVIDDGSTDDTSKILKDLAGSDSRIRLIARERRGLISTLNEGLAMARGEFIARMDGDDISLPDRFARQIDYLDGHVECIALGCQTQTIDADGLPMFRQTYPLDHPSIDALCMRGHGAIPHPGAMMRRAALLSIGGYRDAFVAAEDLDLWLRLAEHGQLANHPDVLLEYRLHLQSVSIERAEIQVRSARNAVVEACQRRGIAPPPAESLRTLAAADPSRSIANWCHLALADGKVEAAMRLAKAAIRLQPLRLLPYACMLRALVAAIENPIHRRILSRFPGVLARTLTAQSALQARHELHESGDHRAALRHAWQACRAYPSMQALAFLGGSIFRFARSTFAAEPERTAPPALPPTRQQAPGHVDARDA